MSETLTPVRFGLVGAGAIAQAYAQAFASSEQVQLAAVADCRIEAAEALAETASAASFSSVESMVEEMDLEAVIVCTPPVTHDEVCDVLFARGINVLCEKPLAVDSETAARMAASAKEADVIFTMASKFRYVADVAQAKSIIASGVLGEVVLFENIFTGRVDMTQRWNSDPSVSGGGVLIDNGTHSVDITRYFLGELVDIQAMEGHRIQELPVEDTAKMFVRSRSGVLASIDLSWSVSKELPYFIAVYGSAGTLLVGWQESKYRRSGDSDWTVFGSGYQKVAAFQRQLENFAGAVRGTESLLVEPADALASVSVIEAAYRSLAKGDWEPIVEVSAKKASAI
ncbi:Gfo/Idh/MocA family protein [Adhaeretor mobilis]|uniref:Putative oxidoreductase YcjS n=1 Tax=Adhaeretor mobilis TaxID=1930276 RepID=A0A517MVU9_9BACT|nr:Gfo/Idh/MocA family oxidoreductase [Adhaeretor mobilis]QDS99004.1 putative oxidoreductase YcjS [Adhaeretor mobilis]